MFPLPIEKTVIFLAGTCPNADRNKKEKTAVFNINLDFIESLNYNTSILF
jgi:hypothetical protein